MTTITTKQLRENMLLVIKDLQKGKAVKLSYRHKVIGSLQPVSDSPIAQHRGSASAIQHYLSNSNFGPIPKKLQQSNRTFKQEITKLRNNDFGLK